MEEADTKNRERCGGQGNAKGRVELHGEYQEWLARRVEDDVAARFKLSFSRECKPYFIGVWDNVASIGWVRRKQFSKNRLNHDVAYGYQALALDERRHHFRVSQWDETDLPAGQAIEQVCFPGSHGDVGGQEADQRISDITLEWMLRHAEGKGLNLRPGWRESLVADHSGEIRRSDRHIWRLGAKDRRIPDGAKIHRSVVERMADPISSYQPGNLTGSYVEVD